MFLIAFLMVVDISWEVEWLDRFDWCSVAWVGCGLYVEFMDDVDVVVVYYCDAGCFTCSGDGYSHLIADGCLLGGLVVCVCGWVSDGLFSWMVLYDRLLL